MQNRKAVVLGSGPSGIFCAIILAKRGYHVSVYDKREDFSKQDHEVVHNRAYVIALSRRAMRAFEYANLPHPSTFGSVQHGNYTVMRTRTVYKRFEDPIICVKRHTLINMLLQEAKKLGVQFYFEKKCTGIDFVSKQIFFDQETAPYDFLIGSDGIHSQTRQHMQEVVPNFSCTVEHNPNRSKQMFIRPGTHKYALNEGYFFTGKDIMCVLSPTRENGFDVCLNWNRAKTHVNDALSNPNEYKSILAENFGSELADVLVPVEGFFDTPDFFFTSVTCSQYHYLNTVLIGDAAHAMYPLYSQGCNAALEDCVILDQILNTCKDDLSRALPEFTRVRRPDTNAMVEFCRIPFPERGFKLFIYMGSTILARKMHEILPSVFHASAFEILQGTDVPYRKLARITQVQDGMFIALVSSILFMLVYTLVFVVRKAISL
jgi:kynurenine 3-monooxygenase